MLVGRSLRRAHSLLLVLLACSLACLGRERWTELNLGPFYVDCDGNTAAGRELLTELEQVRWVMAGLLDDPNLTLVFPIRVVLSSSVTGRGGFVSQISGNLRADRLVVLRPDQKLHLGEVAGILLDENTPPLPAEVESGMRRLFDTLEAHGSHVTWGGSPTRPDLDFARMALFATKFEYSASFHILLTSLRSGSSLKAGESNAFGQSYNSLEKEAENKLKENRFEAVSVTGRPLDPKRDFGEHSFSEDLAEVYLADNQATSDPTGAETIYRKALNVGGAVTSAAYEGLAQLAEATNQNPAQYLDGAIQATSRSPRIYLAAAKGRPKEEALKLAKRAETLNGRWAEPLALQAALASTPTEREALLTRAVKLDRRQPILWIQLAQVQVETGHAGESQSSWIRAEDAAASEEERATIHEQRMAAQAHRLDAAEATREAQENALYLADQRAQRAEIARIRAAERKANSSVESSAGRIASAEPAVSWSRLTQEKKFDGSLIKVDCLGSNARLELRDRGGSTLHLLWRNTSELGLACGPQQPPIRVSITYSASADDQNRTDGAVSTMRAWPSSTKNR